MIFKQCSFCRFIVSIFDKFVFEEDVSEKDLREDGDVVLSYYSTSKGSLTLGVNSEGRTVSRSIVALEGSYSMVSSDNILQARRVTGMEMDITMILGWINACEKFHGEKCQPRSITRPNGLEMIPSFRVIDVLDFCVITAPNPCRYISLSYVWGGVPLFRLTKENKVLLSQPGSLKEHSAWSYIPQTIRDAIILTQQLGERYLWIDSFCLVQDDLEDLQNGISTMDLVYELSYMTIIAGAGSHAHFGLPGIRKQSRIVDQEAVEVIPGLQLTTLQSLTNRLETSEYSSRAWT